ncbi:MAG: toll/interleukin-1 receptor domain-containing protein [Nitrospira sp.]|nr:toll/interleukin-1 receptor domain-containing protein [Nitrospira sp.]
MSTILISYRREDSADVTGRIYDRLVQQFGAGSIFQDVDSIPFGVDFRKYLDEQVGKCDVFLAVIGPGWVEAKNSEGQARLEDPKDHVRIEIEWALKRKIPVIPVLVRDAKIPAAERLPAAIQDLSYRNGIEVRPDPDFHRDLDRLIKFLKQEIKGLVDQPPEPSVAGKAVVEDLSRRPSSVSEERFSPVSKEKPGPGPKEKPKRVTQEGHSRETLAKASEGQETNCPPVKR